MSIVPKQNRRTTLKDVGASVGVSVATVSYVLNGKHMDRVSPKTRRRVLKAVEELNYSPNATARSLVTNKTHMIGVYLPQHLEKVFGEPGKERMLSGIIQKSTLEDYQVVLALAGNDPRRYSVDGWLCLQPSQRITALEKRELPLIYIDPDFEPDEHTLCPANEEAGILLGGLLSKTAKRIAFIQSSPQSSSPQSSITRYRGLLTGLGEQHETSIIAPEKPIEDRELWLEALFEKTCNFADFDTLVADNETLGCLLLKHGLKQGISIPETLQVAAFAGTDISQWSFPQLTTVDMKYPELAYRATRLLLDHIHESSRNPESPLKLGGPPSPVLLIGDTVRHTA